MIFDYIKLENFRQYKDIQQIFFSSRQNEGSITLIVADNGAGKTTLLQAFRYCFYGNLQNNKYINLPNPNDLITNTILDEINEGDIKSVSVEIQFSHFNRKYVMRRESDYKKTNNRMIYLETRSSLIYSTDFSGFSTLNNDEADLEMLQILPSGLSHIFMFDGERMEKRIDSNDFRIDLKDSILGLLNIKTYDFLIQQIGTISKKTTLLGKLEDKISHTTVEQIDETNKLKKIQEKNESCEQEISILKTELDNKKNVLSEAKKIQEKIVTNREIVVKRDNYERQREELEEKILNVSRDMLLVGFQALYKKELVKVRKLYSKFIQSQKDDENFYQFLHIETLKEILERGQCICGTKIVQNSFHEDHIKKLFESALPNSNSQYLSFISSDIFYNASNLLEDKEKLLSLNLKLDNLVDEKISLIRTINRLNIEIRENESILGESSQVNIEEIQEKIEIIREKIGFLESALNQGKRAERIQTNKVMPMLEQNDNNKKVTHAIKEVTKLVEQLKFEKERLEERARLTLTKYFNENLSLVMNGNYYSEIRDDYFVKITDKDRNIDSTSVLSTGQSVIVSISFIRALIDTAAELSKEYSKDDSYAVIMDAAFSNLDEKHIKNVSKYNLNNFDQLIFISFKRQLRDELYRGIKENVGYVYEFVKDKEKVNINKIEKESIESFIHEMVSENE